MGKLSTVKQFMAKGIFASAIVLMFALMPGSYANAAAGEETNAILLDQYSSLDTQAVDAKTGMVSGTFKAQPDGLSGISAVTHKIICPEDGYYRINYSAVFRGEEGIIRDWDNNSMSLTLCANELGTKIIVDPVVLGLGDAMMDGFVQLSKGTYYLIAEPHINSKEKDIDTVYTVSFGYLPLDTTFIEVNKSVDAAAKKVTLTISSLDAVDIRVKPGKDNDLAGILWSGLDNVGNGGSYTITEGSEDGYFTIRAEDKYSNVHGISVQVSEFEKPAAPVIKGYKSGAASVSGTSVPGSTVSVVVSGKTYSAKADAKGAWSVKTALLKAGAEVSAYATSSFGVKSEKSAAIVKNVSFAKPKVKTAKKNTKKVTGTAKAKSTVYVKIGKKIYSAKAKANGKFTVKTCKLKKKMKLVVYAKDTANNTSKKANYTVK